MYPLHADDREWDISALGEAEKRTGLRRMGHKVTESPGCLQVEYGYGSTDSLSPHGSRSPWCCQ